MKKTDVMKFISKMGRRVDKYSPEILTGIGIAGMITTTVLAVRATPKALVLMDKAENEKNDELTKVEMVKAAWKPYLPVVITGALSTTCLIGSVRIGARRTAAIATAYKLSETALSEYREKVVEAIGEKKEKAIKDKIAEEKLEKNPVSKSSVILTGDKTLFFDGSAGGYFESDIETVKRAVNEVNRQMVYDQYVSLNEFYDKIGRPHTELGDELGWNLDYGLVDVDFSSMIADNGKPCIVITYNVAPRYDYSKLM